MKLKFTDHAQYRLYKRNFSTEQMKQTILFPDFTRVSYGKIVSSKRFSNGGLGVVYVMRGNTYIIITVFFN